MRRRCLFLLIGVLGWGAASSLSGQSFRATLEGRVLDASGAVLPGATVKAINDNTGLSRSTVSNDLGFYRLPALPIGPYTVSAELSGFTTEAARVSLQVGQTATLDFSLSPGGLAQEVTVVARETLLEPTQSAVASVINEAQIESLPVNGRQFIDFTLLAPGSRWAKPLQAAPMSSSSR